MVKIYRIANLDCAHCASKIERAIAKISGVNNANLNFMMQKLIVDIDDNMTAEVMPQINSIVKKIEPSCVLKG